MIFFIIKSFKHKEKTYSRQDKYIEMPYDEAKVFIRRRKLKLAGSQDKKGFEDNKIKIVKTTTKAKTKAKPKIEVKNDKEISKKSKPNFPNYNRSAGTHKRSNSS